MMRLTKKKIYLLYIIPPMIKFNILIMIIMARQGFAFMAVKYFLDSIMKT
jgi:hypothetical protein